MTRLTVIMTFVLSFLTCAAARAQESDGIFRHVLFSVDTSDKDRPVRCYRIPALTTAPDGSLIAAIDERVPSCGDLRWNRDINIVARRSTDGGRTWGPVQRIVDFPDGESASDPSMITDTQTGTVWLFYNYMDQDRERDRYRFHVVSSSDNGQTWSAPVDITSQVAPEDWKGDFKFITSGQGAFTRDGRMLHTMVNLQRGLFLIVSDDHGRSWYRLPAVIHPADESKVVELHSGGWMINSRVNNEGCRYIHVSKDDGKTWNSRPVPDLPDPGCNGAIIHYPYYGERGCLLFINASDPVERRRLTVHYSTDRGETWSRGLTVVEGDAAYSDITVLPSGDIVLFYERDSYTVNEVAVVPRSVLFPDGHK
ncbi:MAG TPA: glycoside hydrolase [Candidatus Coprenecus pullistercoris]|nr:glycoside hydrolase [Candidatus Coprenecus pullistercoris]